MVPTYVQPADLITIFEEQEIVEASNLRDGYSVEADSDRLEAVCTGANGLVYGYLSRRFTDEQLQLTALTDGFLAALKIHAANIARHQLDASTEEVRNRFNDAIEWLQAVVDDGTNGGETVLGQRFPSIAYSIPERGREFENSRFHGLF